MYQVVALITGFSLHVKVVVVQRTAHLDMASSPGPFSEKMACYTLSIHVSFGYIMSCHDKLEHLPCAYCVGTVQMLLLS